MKNDVIKRVVRLGVLVAILMCGLLTTSSYAAHEISGTALLFTYYDVRPVADDGLGTSDNYFTVTNPDPTNWVQAHVRVRTGDKSVELLDFDVMLSPNDVFTFTVSDDGVGVTFSSLDKHTIANTKMLAPFLIDLNGDAVTDGIVFSTNPASPYFNTNLTSLITTCQTPITQDAAAALTKKGYVEVIMEGKIARLSASCKNSCGAGVDTLACTADDVLVTTHTLYELASNVVDGTTGLCDAAVASASNGLEGRVFYATIDAAGSVSRLAHLNAETMDNALSLLPVTIDALGRGIIMHKNTYDLERASARCVAAGDSDGDAAGDNTVENCFAYTAATTVGADLDAVAIGGADDMNFCFYKDSIGGTGVHNKFGAAATFGPTMADLPAVRLGLLPATAASVNAFSLLSSGEWSAFNGLSTGGIFTNKTFIHTHYLNSPAPQDFDVNTALAFIFPVQHFVSEVAQVGSFKFYDLNENEITPPTSGFISPGLPGPGAPINEEASLQTLGVAPFAEGWIRIGAVSATNATSATACDPGAVCPGATVNTLVRTGAAAYTPGYTGAVFVGGEASLSSSLLQYLNY